MTPSLSNIALPPFGHAAELCRLPGLGIAGLEVAPSRVWRDTWHGLATANVAAYRRQVEDAGLAVVGLHSLFYDHPDLGLFKDREARAATLDFMAHLSAVCRDLGGRTLIYGGGRRRGAVTAADAVAECVAFFGELIPRIESHGTVFCFEPLGPQDTDFIHSVRESLAIVEAVDHPSLAVQLDAKALVENGELDAGTVGAVRHRLVHVHSNEPGLGVLGGTGAVDHAAFGRYLRQAGYGGWVSIEQRMRNADDPLADVAASAAVVRRAYGADGNVARTA